MYCTRESGRVMWLRFEGCDGCHPCLSSEAVGENEAWCWSVESRCVALKQSRMAVRVSHGWDVPIHSLLESCLSMQLTSGGGLHNGYIYSSSAPHAIIVKRQVNRECHKISMVFYV